MGELPSQLKLRDGRVIKFPAIMGVLNVTPDSFSDGGRYLDPERAVARGLEMEAAGADIIDVGGESTRPIGAREVPLEVELERILPVLAKLGANLRVPISIDTRRSAVARAALDSGASIINDITALTGDLEMARLAAKERCAVVLMHMRGSAQDHVRFARYRDVVREVVQYLGERAQSAIAAGIAKSRIIVDPGLGFAKNADHNLKLLDNLPELCALGFPVLIGASRKRFVRRIAGDSAAELEYGSAAVNAIAIARGASIVRVHEPAIALATVKMAAALSGRGGRYRHHA
ncbi:MAG: dihydropteroate synthase [Candidatus Binatus sp.]|uniref:dihydropteroate synthase n=1 Tax=Candidatus Binatus sp. TaxID=2811406 RepID=UPI0027208808|nr:dihydropteroate synthase [Candidatus Binatus sp.]MDO8434825.1 dihydropteroate synthase [Candidatus Binatus sp.]